MTRLVWRPAYRLHPLGHAVAGFELMLEWMP